MKKVALGILAAVAGLVAANASHAALLNGGIGMIPGRPDVFSVLSPVDVVGSDFGVSYNASTRRLTVTGYPQQITYPDNSATQFQSQTSYLYISVVLNSNNVAPQAVSGGMLLTADLDGLGLGDNLIYSSNAPSEFGFGDSQLEFVFANNIGVVGTGKSIGIHITDRAGLPGAFDWTKSFNTGESTVGVVDAWVPEPTALGVLAPVVGLMGRRRRA
jgi:hypothetical protein